MMSAPVQAQTPSTQSPTTLEGWADHLSRFGNAIPQEKVFVHLDNTCYFLGDTIWYAAYTRRTDKGVPSNVSRVLYVELYNQDGYLVERQLTEMKNGRGHGNFVLADTLYGGFYELRAYTRWQLNWGMTQHPHTKYAEEWFFNKAMAREYYRDYEKLYSRVFPIYNKPKEPGDYAHDMSVRPLRRTAKEKDKSGLVLSIFPEGGSLIAGAPCRMAFEAVTEEGEWQQGKLELLQDGKTAIQTAEAVNRGRGLISFTPQEGAKYEARFTSTSGKTVTMKLPKILTDGVALNIVREGDQWVAKVTPKGILAQRPLGLTVQHEGVVEQFETLNGGRLSLKEELPAGVHQVTVFDDAGRVWADRLFFVTRQELTKPSLSVNGLKAEYEPFEQVSLEVTAPAQESALSLAVRDAALQDYLYDCGNIMTEMLLASEIKGFVPQPDYFFEADDEEHRSALDLLMMTQGWRRFDWHTMATPKAFAINHPAEYTQILSGIVHNYSAQQKADEIRDNDVADHQAFMEAGTEDAWAEDNNEETGLALASEGTPSDLAYQELVNSLKEYKVPEGQFSTNGLASSRFFADESRLKRETLVHAEFVQPGSKDGIIGDAVTEKGRFRMQIPDFHGYCLLFLSASDTTKWKADKPHQWISMDEEDYPEFYVRLSFPYPRFVKPYDFYHTHYPEVPKSSIQTMDFLPDVTTMNTVTVNGRRRGLRKFNAAYPAFVLDAYEAFNAASDAGLCVPWYQGHNRFVTDIARTYIGDMNMDRNYNIEIRYNSLNSSHYHTSAAINAYNQLYNLDKVYVYTDYSPRREGSTAFNQDNQPTVTIDLRRPKDEGMRTTYRDRYYALQGFNVADDFYHPNYSQHRMPEGQGDYRRTLYWNPDLKTDAEGKAHVTFFTGSKPTAIMVKANGQAADGTLLTN